MKSNTQRDLVILLFITFIAVAVWVGINVYHNLNSSTIDQQLNIQVAPISGQFDTTTLNNLKNRQDVQPLYDAITVTPTPSISPTTTPTVQSDTSSSSGSGEVSAPAQ